MIPIFTWRRVESTKTKKGALTLILSLKLENLNTKRESLLRKSPRRLPRIRITLPTRTLRILMKLETLLMAEPLKINQNLLSNLKMSSLSIKLKSKEEPKLAKNKPAKPMNRPPKRKLKLNKRRRKNLKSKSQLTRLIILELRADSLKLRSRRPRFWTQSMKKIDLIEDNKELK